MKKGNDFLLVKLDMLGEDSYLSDFSRANYFFQQFDDFLDELLPDWPKTLRPVHYARLLPKSAWIVYEQLFIEHGYSISSRFPSMIIQDYLSQKYNKQVSVEIIKIATVSQKEIELFIVSPILAKEIVERENLELRHFALSLEEKDFSNFIAILIKVGFDEVLSGNNQHEKSSTTYFQKNFGENSLRLEIFKKE